MLRSILVLCLLFCSIQSVYSAEIYLATRNVDGGIFKIDSETAVATRIDDYSSSHCYTSLSIYNNEKFVTTDVINLRIMMFDLDGNYETEYNVYERPEDVVMVGEDHFYYASYYSAEVREYNNGSNTLWYNTDSTRGYALAMRSYNSLYIGTNKGVYSGYLISGSTPPSGYHLVVDDDDNLLYAQNGDAIYMISSTNQYFTYWSKSAGDPDISAIYSLAYNASDDAYYGIGADLSGEINLYSFVGDAGAVTVTEEISNITGLTGGYGYVLSESNLLITGSFEEPQAIPEPLSIGLIGIGLFGILKKKNKL